jgi:hypothetical protein
MFSLLSQPHTLIKNLSPELTHLSDCSVRGCWCARCGSSTQRALQTRRPSINIHLPLLCLKNNAMLPQNSGLKYHYYDSDNLVDSVKVERNRFVSSRSSLRKRLHSTAWIDRLCRHAVLTPTTLRTLLHALCSCQRVFGAPQLLLVELLVRGDLIPLIPCPCQGDAKSASVVLTALKAGETPILTRLGPHRALPCPGGTANNTKCTDLAGSVGRVVVT